MPQIKIDYIVSFSSEHPDHPASNLLSKEINGKRWICLGKGESSASIVFQLEKSVNITSVHIGNYHSALIEVLVGRSEAPNQQYEVLLCTSSFMTPADSRNSQNISNLKTFNSEQLVQSVQAKKWDRIRVVCTQPYNKHVQYGLSFIHFFSSDTLPSNNIQDSPSSSQMLGKFKLRTEDAIFSLKPGELFRRRKQGESLSTDAQIRQASLPNNCNDTGNLLVKMTRPSTSKTIPLSPKISENDLLFRARDEIMYTDDDNEHNEKIDKLIQKNKDEREKIIEKNLTIKTNKEISKANNVNSNIMKASRDKTDKNSTVSMKNSKTETDVLRKRSHSNDTKQTKKVCTEENRVQPTNNIPRGPTCLQGVVFVISGYINPKRSILRDNAILLGARYCADWKDTCTHLICAFSNTPKHEQVKRSRNGGIVVTGEWIENCFKEKAHLPWKWYATDPKERTPYPTSQELSQLLNRGSNDDTKEDIHNDNNDTDMGEDTDDEIEKVLREKAGPSGIRQEYSKMKHNTQKLFKNFLDSDEELDDDSLNKGSFTIEPKPTDNPYTVDTESDTELNQPKRKQSENNSFENTLPDTFSNIKFYIDPNIKDEKFDYNELKRYIEAYSGLIINTWPEKNIDVAITTSTLVNNLRELKNKKCKFLVPQWIYKCHNSKTLYSFEKYEIR